MNRRPIRGWTKPLHERGMKAGSMPERLLIGPGSPHSIDPVYPELSHPPEPCPAPRWERLRTRSSPRRQQLTPLPCGGPARLDPSLEPRRSAVLISGLATGPPAGLGGGLGPFLAV